MVSKKRGSLVCGCSVSCWRPWKSIWSHVCLLQQGQTCPELLPPNWVSLFRAPITSAAPAWPTCSHTGHSPSAPVSPWGGVYCWWTFRCSPVPIWGLKSWLGDGVTSLFNGGCPTLIKDPSISLWALCLASPWRLLLQKVPHSGLVPFV